MCACVREHVCESSYSEKFTGLRMLTFRKVFPGTYTKYSNPHLKRLLNAFNFTLVPFGIAVSSTSRQRILHATKRTEMDCNRERAVRSQFQTLLLTVHITCVFQNGEVQYIQALRDKLQAFCKL